jgi:D-alanine-D-alanine ligase
MDKVRSKHVFQATGIATPDYRVLETPGDAILAADKMGYPLVFKPSGQGSSVGMSKVFDASEVGAAVDLALGFGRSALAERCIVGDELTVAVLHGQALPSIRIETPRVFYDYRAKYESDSTKYYCPGTADAEQELRLQNLAVAACHELGCRGWARVDFMTERGGETQVLEVNTVPGMTSHSLVPMAARQAGIDFDELCWRILETSFVDRSVVSRPVESGVAREVEAAANGA